MTTDSDDGVRRDLRLEVRTLPTWTVVSLEGELDVATSAALRSALRDAEGAEGVVVDLEQVTFIDSTALGVLLAGQRGIEEGGGILRLVVTTPRIGRVLEIAGLGQVFDVYESLSDATAPRS